MVRFKPEAGIYAPIRIVLYGQDGGSVLAYDRPSDQFGQFGDGRVVEVGRYLDRAVEAIVRRVNGQTDGDPADRPLRRRGASFGVGGFPLRPPT